MKYIIQITEEQSFEFCMSKLLPLGFVFSSERLKSMDEIKFRWPTWSAWKSLTMFDDRSKCKMVIHASQTFSSENMYYSHISLDKFISDVYPFI